MKKLLSTLVLLTISFSIVINPSVAYSKTISVKTKFNKIGCNIDLLSFDEYLECVDFYKYSSTEAWKNKKQTNDILYLVSILSTLNQTYNEDLITEQNAKNIWSEILNKEYKFKNKNKNFNLKKEIKCIEEDMIYVDFINCIYQEFRNTAIYDEADIVTKYRMENIVSNAMFLSKKEALVLELNKASEVENRYTNEDGYEFFNNLISKLGTDYFKQIKNTNYDGDVKKILLFLLTMILVSYFAKGLLKKAAAKNSIASKNSVVRSTGSKCSTGVILGRTGPSAIDVLCGKGGGWFNYALKARRFLYVLP